MALNEYNEEYNRNEDIEKIYGTNRHSSRSQKAHQDLAALILFNGARGDTLEDIESTHSMLGILSGQMPFFKPASSDEDKILGKGPIYRTLDIKGNPLISGQNYNYNGKIIKVLREEFGAGNVLDTYMRVHYLDSSLKDQVEVIDASYRKGVLNGATYQSMFEPIEPDKDNK